MTVVTFTVDPIPPEGGVCGAIKITTNKEWATVQTVTGSDVPSYLLRVDTNDLSLVGDQKITLTIAYADGSSPISETASVTIKIRHPCFATVISTNQTINEIQYTFGDPMKTTTFV